QVPCALTRPFPRVANGPARDTGLAALRPPAVEDGEVEGAVHGRLHARGSARLHGPAGRVQPHVTAAREQASQGHVVVLEVDDGLRPLADRLDEERDDGLTRLVRGVRLAGEDELQATVLEQGSEPGGIPEQEIRALVGRRAPREADGERLALELHAGARLDLGVELALHRAPRLATRPGTAGPVWRAPRGPRARACAW